MSGAPTDDTGSSWDGLAGEYVLGLLDEDTARLVEVRARAEPALAEAIAAWQDRLDPLADLAGHDQPSDQLWSRISASITPQSKAPEARANPWRGAAIALMAIAAGLAVFVVWSAATRRAVLPWARAVALLAAPGSASAALRAQVTSNGSITVVPLRQIAVPPGKQLGFWAWPASEKAPVLLGMIAPAGGQLRFPFPPREGTPVMVTLEPEGAPAPGAPGPTLFLGLLVAGPA